MSGQTDNLPASTAGGIASVVLVVEDEALVRMHLSDHLKDCGFLVLEACDAHEAIEVLETGVEIDLVITDVKMPGQIDGFGLAKWIRDNQPALPVFVVSGFSGKLDLTRELCAGEQFFTKPYDVEVIASKIQEYIDARRAPKH